MSPGGRRAEYDKVVAVFAALGEPTRLSLVDQLLREQPQSISRLASRTHLTRQAITKHLRVLADAGLVARERAGRESRYLLEPSAIDAARRYLDRASAQWDDAIHRLRQHLGKPDP